MAILVKYVVVFPGKEDMVFSTRKEAEAHDTMLHIAEQLSTFLQGADLPIADATLDALTIFMAQHRVDLGSILKGDRRHAPTVPTAAVVGEAQDIQDTQDMQDSQDSQDMQDSQEEVLASAPRRAKAAPRATANKPQATA